MTLEHSTEVEASRLLHHLLNQSLSGLDFCILWQELVESAPELSEVHREVTGFLETADLAYLDRALGLLPEPPEETLQPVKSRETVVQDKWFVTSTRIRDISRADFVCRNCGFAITLSQEHGPNTEMRLPFENFVCPQCDDLLSNQGSLS